MPKLHPAILVVISILILSTISGCVILTQKPGIYDSEPVSFSTIENINQNPVIQKDPTIQIQDQIEPIKEPSWPQIAAGIKEAFINGHSTIRPYIKAGMVRKQIRSWILITFREKVRKYHGYAIVLLGLLLVWSQIRYHQKVKITKRVTFTMEDLSLLKMIKVSASHIWENHRSGRNVIRLEDWRY